MICTKLKKSWMLFCQIWASFERDQEWTLVKVYEINYQKNCERWWTFINPCGRELRRVLHRVRMSIFWLLLGLAAHLLAGWVLTNYCTGVQRRFASYMYDYFKGSMDQVYQRSQRQYPSFDETLAMRRRSAGVSPLFALAEWVVMQCFL